MSVSRVFHEYISGKPSKDDWSKKSIKVINSLLVKKTPKKT